MSPQIEGAGVPLAADARGEGAPVLVVHDIARPPAPLDLDARVIAYERRGYGASGMPEPYEATTVNEQAEDAAAVLRALADGAAVLVGHGFGAVIALDVAARHAALVAGLVLADPPLFAFVPGAAQALAAERQALEEALRSGGPEAAVEAWLGEESRWARASYRAFFADLAGLATWPVTRGTLRAIAVPAAVITSEDAAPHLVAAADAVAGLIPGASRESGGDVVAAARAILAAVAP